MCKKNIESCISFFFYIFWCEKCFPFECNIQLKWKNCYCLCVVNKREERKWKHVLFHCIRSIHIVSFLKKKTILQILLSSLVSNFTYCFYIIHHWKQFYRHGSENRLNHSICSMHTSMQNNRGVKNEGKEAESQKYYSISWWNEPEIQWARINSGSEFNL